MTAFLNLTVNGEARRSAASTIAELVGELGLKPEKVAVERNGVIVARSTLGAAELAEGDVLEIVHFVGGGSPLPQGARCIIRQSPKASSFPRTREPSEQKGARGAQLSLGPRVRGNDERNYAIGPHGERADA